MIETNLLRARLQKTNLTGAYLSRAYLGEAKLNGANLTGADLAGAILTGANLAGADLTGVNFTGAKLTGAKFAGAKLTGAKFAGADLVDATGIEEAQGLKDNDAWILAAQAHYAIYTTHTPDGELGSISMPYNYWQFKPTDDGRWTASLTGPSYSSLLTLTGLSELKITGDTAKDAVIQFKNNGAEVSLGFDGAITKIKFPGNNNWTFEPQSSGSENYKATRTMPDGTILSLGGITNLNLLNNSDAVLSFQITKLDPNTLTQRAKIFMIPDGRSMQVDYSGGNIWDVKDINGTVLVPQNTRFAPEHTTSISELGSNLNGKVLAGSDISVTDNGQVSYKDSLGLQITKPATEPLPLAD